MIDLIAKSMIISLLYGYFRLIHIQQLRQMVNRFNQTSVIGFGFSQLSQIVRKLISFFKIKVLVLNFAYYFITQSPAIFIQL
jgi:hypothetical protein